MLAEKKLDEVAQIWYSAGPVFDKPFISYTEILILHCICIDLYLFTI